MRRILLLVALSLLGHGSSLAAQEVFCNLDSQSARTDPTDPATIIIDAPFVVNCDDGATIRANSGRLNRATSEVYLLGDVFFEDAENTLTAQEATYNRETAFLVAIGDVRFEDRVEGSTLTGPHLEYYRVTETRPLARMFADQRPTLMLRPEASGDSPEPIQLVADRVDMVGQDDLSAFGSVEITRTDLLATSGEASYRAAIEELELRQNAVITSEGRRLSGDVVFIRLVDNEIDFLHARTNAALASDELDVTGDDLQLFFVEEQLDRAITVGLKVDSAAIQATAASPTFALTADSLDAMFLDQRLVVVRAIGNARGTSIDTVSVIAVATAAPDSTLAVSGDSVVAAAAPVPSAAVVEAFASDWVRGDTIIGYFIPVEENVTEVDSLAIDPVPNAVVATSSDSTAVDLERIVALGNAQSLYRLRGEDDAPGERRNLNFLVGERIELEMADGELEVATVDGLQYGIYVEPEPEMQAPPPAEVVVPAPEPGPGAGNPLPPPPGPTPANR